MDNKNVFIAIALSMSVLLFWGAFFESPNPIDQSSATQQQVKEKAKNNNDITPNINQVIETTSVSREESIGTANRIKIENKNIIGTISLKGALIDDISFKNHKQNLEENNNVEFLNPKQTENGYFIETGWTSIGNKVKVPSLDSTWTVIGNNILSENKPITLNWKNDEGIIF